MEAYKSYLGYRIGNMGYVPDVKSIPNTECERLQISIA